MASFIYDNAWKHILAGNMDFSDDAAGDSTESTFKMALVTSTYTPAQGTHEFYTDMTNQVANGSGYTTGGVATTPTVAVDGSAHEIEVSFTNAVWTSATISANAAVVYRSTGTDSTSQLLAYLDFGGTVASTSGTFTVSVSTPLTISNPAV